MLYAFIADAIPILLPVPSPALLRYPLPYWMVFALCFFFIPFLEQIVWTNLYIFHILSYQYIKSYLIQPLTYPFYPPYVSTLSPQSLWITAEKVDKSVKNRFSHQEVGKSSEKRGFYIALPKKTFTLHYAILCTTIKLSGSSSHYAVYMLYTL